MSRLKQSAALLVTLAACVALILLAATLIGRGGAPAVTYDAAAETENGEGEAALSGIEMTVNSTEQFLVQSKSGDDAPLAEGDFIFPLKTERGEITSPFGRRSEPEPSFHNGVDIDADEGDPVLAAKEGTVVLAEEQKNGYGLVTAVYHGGQTFTLYAHCSKLLVKVGDEVKRGETIALAGETGYALGAHLHFEVIANGAPVDPLEYI